MGWNQREHRFWWRFTSPFINNYISDHVPYIKATAWLYLLAPILSAAPPCHGSPRRPQGKLNLSSFAIACLPSLLLREFIAPCLLLLLFSRWICFYLYATGRASHAQYIRTCICPHHIHMCVHHSTVWTARSAPDPSGTYMLGWIWPRERKLPSRCDNDDD